VNTYAYSLRRRQEQLEELAQRTLELEQSIEEKRRALTGRTRHQADVYSARYQSAEHLAKAKQRAAEELERNLEQHGLTWEHLRDHIACHQRLQSPLCVSCHRATTRIADLVHTVADERVPITKMAIFKAEGRIQAMAKFPSEPTEQDLRQKTADRRLERNTTEGYGT
jgi:hypothetical protein